MPRACAGAIAQLGRACHKLEACSLEDLSAPLPVEQAPQEKLAPLKEAHIFAPLLAHMITSEEGS